MEEELRAIIAGDPAVLDLVPGDSIVWGRRNGLPAVALWRVTGRPDYHLKGASGLEESVVQIDCWGASYGQAKMLARAIKAVISGRHGGVFRSIFIDNERDGHEAADGASDPDTPSDFYRTSLDARVWSTVS